MVGVFEDDVLDIAGKLYVRQHLHRTCTPLLQIIDKFDIWYKPLVVLAHMIVAAG